MYVFDVLFMGTVNVLLYPIVLFEFDVRILSLLLLKYNDKKQIVCSIAVRAIDRQCSSAHHYIFLVTSVWLCNVKCIVSVKENRPKRCAEGKDKTEKISKAQ